jgi:hypothetical protein
MAYEPLNTSNDSTVAPIHNYFGERAPRLAPAFHGAPLRLPHYEEATAIPPPQLR